MPIDNYVNLDGYGLARGVKSFGQMVKEENERVEIGKYYVPNLPTYIPSCGSSSGGSGSSSFNAAPAFGPEPPPGGAPL